MSTAIQLRRGTTAQHAGFTGKIGEVTVDTDKNSLVVHDGSTAGGFPVGRNTDLTIETITDTTYTAVLDDASSKLKQTTSDSAVAITIPANSSVAFPVGSVLSFQQGGDGNITVSGDTGVTLDTIGGVAAATYVKNSILQIIKVGTDEWLVASGGAPGYRFLTTRNFNVAGSGTYTPDVNVRAIIVEGRGGGGAGGTPATSNNAGGGSQGGYSEKFITVLASSYAYTVGAGGTPVASDGSQHNGGNGGDTTFGTEITAGGGLGGAYNAVAGGTATGGDRNIPGALGNPRVSTTDGFAGTGGGEGGGLGGVASGSNDGSDGTMGGGGGGGRDAAGTGAKGGTGGDGWLKITEFG